MKKNILFFLSLIIILSLIFSFVFGKAQKNSKLEHIKLAEVAHSVFYAPQYVAIEKGYFKNNNIDIELLLTPGADKVSAAVLSGDANVGLCGSEATIYIYNAGERNYLKTFSQLTQKDGSFIVSRKKIKNFSLKKLKGKKIIGGRSGGMPEMTLEYALKSKKINPKNDLTIDTSIEFSSMSSSFIGGNGDFVSLFEPNASEIEKNGYGYVVESIGKLAGNVPYTSYSAKSNYLDKHKDLIRRFNESIQMGLDYVNNHTEKEIASTILKQFPNTSLNDLANSIKRYKKIDAWPKNTNFSKNSFDHLQDIMIDYGIIKDKVSYNKLFFKEK